jgi:hypothetical protein
LILKKYPAAGFKPAAFALTKSCARGALDDRDRTPPGAEKFAGPLKDFSDRLKSPPQRRPDGFNPSD